MDDACVSMGATGVDVLVAIEVGRSCLDDACAMYLPAAEHNCLDCRQAAALKSLHECLVNICTDCANGMLEQT